MESATHHPLGIHSIVRYCTEYYESDGIRQMDDGTYTPDPARERAKHHLLLDLSKLLTCSNAWSYVP